MVRKKIVYPIVPSRFDMETWDIILNFIREKGYVPFDHRRGAPFEDFELKLGRKKTLSFLINIMRQCDVVWIFGISEGGMGEFKTALDIRDTNGNIEILVSLDFDPEWEKYYNELKRGYGNPIERLRGTSRLLALVGPRAVGKTFWIDQLTEAHGSNLGRIRNTTTRKPRNDRDHLSYHFVSKREFEQGLRENRFLEHDVNDGEYYGSSIDSIREVLETSDGVFAITPSGARELHKRRFEINLTILLLRTESEEVLKRNFESRGIIDPTEQERLLAKAREFSMPPGVPHIVVKLSGDVETDRERILSAIYPKP